MVNIKSCFLKCVKNLHPPILLTDGQEIFIGRCPTTNITDVQLSRKQVSLQADYKTATVNFKQIGPNSSALAGIEIKRNENHKLKHLAKIELLTGKYVYEINFEPKPIYLSDGTIKIENEDAAKSEIDVKSNSSQSKNDKRPRSPEDANGITKKFKTHNVSLQSNVKKGDYNTTLEITQDTWEDVSNGKLLIFTKSGVTASSKIAAYDLDGTLIKTKSGLVFAKNKDDWQIAFKQIPKHLKELETQGYKLVIFTNQAGIGKGKTDPKEFKGKVEAILNKLNVPMQVFISTTKGIYRKPLTGMWKVLTEQKNCGVSVSKADCFYCGDAAGRPDKWALGKKKDFSAADRLMAKNLGIAFYTPEEHFEKAKVVQWNKPGFDPPSLKNLNISRFDPPNAKLIQSEQEVIVLVGCPGSGKSFISKELVQSGYVHVNRDTLGSWQKCVAAMKNALQNGKSVVVDNTNADKESRNRYIVAAGKVKVRCGVMTTSFDHCRHNNIFRELTDKTHKEIKDMILFSYRKNFVEPTLSEGFAEIFKINFIPQFDNKEHEELYYMYLLEK